MIVPVMGKDPRWLQVEVCREFQRGKCSRSEDECRFAHPPSHVAIHNGRVTACFDSLKGRCQREKCKYLHPPKHLKTQLETNGRMMQHQQQHMALQQQTFPLAQQILSNPTLLPTWPLTVPTSNGTFIQQPIAFLPDPSAMSGAPRRLDKSDKLEVCREYQRGACTRDESECRYAHPPRHASIDTSDGMVTVCMDFIKGKCQRESCKYFHPPLHLQGRVKAAQQQQQMTAGASLQSMPGVHEPYKKQSALEVPLVLPSGAFGQPFQQGLTTMQFTQAMMPTFPLLAGLTGGLPVQLPTQQPQWQQLPPSCNYIPMDTGTPPPGPPMPAPAMSPPIMTSQHQQPLQPMVQQEFTPQPLYEPYQYQIMGNQGQSIELQYCDGVYYPVVPMPTYTIPTSPL